MNITMKRERSNNLLLLAVLFTDVAHQVEVEARRMLADPAGKADILQYIRRCSTFHADPHCARIWFVCVQLN